MLTNICDKLGIVPDMKGTSLALLHFSHELLQTPVLLQGICHLLGSHWPDGVLLQAEGEGSFSKAGHRRSQAKDSMVQVYCSMEEGSPGKDCFNLWIVAKMLLID